MHQRTDAPDTPALPCMLLCITYVLLITRELGAHFCSVLVSPPALPDAHCTITKEYSVIEATYIARDLQ